MPFVEHVHDGHHVHTCAVSVRRVHVVRYGDKADTVSGKDIVDVLSDLDIVSAEIVSAETGQVFYHDGIDAARFCIVQQPPDFGPVKVRSRISVVHILIHQVPAPFRNVLMQDEPLVVDGERLSRALVVFGKSQIDPRMIQLSLL